MDQDSVAWRVADSEAVVLHADSSAYFGLNRSATRLWATLVETPLSEAQLTEWAGKAFLDPPDRLSAEISTFLERLVELDLLRRAENGEAPAAALAPAASAEPWESPAVEHFGELEKLILSSE